MLSIKDIFLVVNTFRTSSSCVIAAFEGEAIQLSSGKKNNIKTLYYNNL
jgi:hypothetical protein